VAYTNFIVYQRTTSLIDDDDDFYKLATDITHTLQ